MKNLWLIGFLQICNLVSFAQDSRSATQLAEKIKSYNSSRAIEKAYLHFDKPFYTAGDTVYFKAYVTVGQLHVPSTISGVLHVDLINTNDKIDRSVKLQLNNGVAWGDFALPDSLPKGAYRVRAYTRWMQNEGDSSYFYQTIPVSAVSRDKFTVYKKRTLNKAGQPDLQFFPESGQLVCDIKSKVAFKAVNAGGLGLGLTGTVIDNTGKEVSHFASAHLGMGCFSFTPAEGAVYTANVTFSDGSRQVLTLPAASARGVVLQVNNDSIAKTSIKVIASEAYFRENQNRDYTLMISSPGKVITVDCKLDSAETSFDVLKRRLHTGVCTATLFNSVGVPVAERLFFVKNYDQLKLDISIDKLIYSPHEKVNINLNATNRADSAITGHFSVSVTDESKVRTNENEEQTILTNLLMTSDLKGFIEQPNYYFRNNDQEAITDLDLVMLTHGFRRFDWKHLLDNNSPLAYQPETGLDISGAAKNFYGRQLTHASVTLLPAQGGYTTRLTDEKGFFRFDNLLFTDSAKFILQAVNKKGGNYTKLIYNKDDNVPPVILDVNIDTAAVRQQMSAYMLNRKLHQADEEKFGSVRGRLLKEVKIKAFKPDNHYKSSSMLGPGLADKVLHADDIGVRGTIADMLLEKGVGGTRYILDRAPVSADALSTLPASIVETVEVYKGVNAAIFGLLNPVVVITTGRMTKLSDISSTGILPITVQGFYKAREFYSPKYEHNDVYTVRKDLRTTIYWQPELLTDKNGNAGFSFYNADGAGKYRVVVEGIDSNGNLGRQVMEYTVK